MHWLAGDRVLEDRYLTIDIGWGLSTELRNIHVEVFAGLID
jgi:hypothetical protein